VGAEEALAIGLVDRLAPPGGALDAALALATELTALPQACLRSDRRSLIEQWGLDDAAAMRNEVRRGLDVLATGEPARGAARFVGGPPAGDPSG
jgi:enoyl-CoA hydratase